MVFAVAGGIVVASGALGGGKRTDLLLHAVKRQPLTLTVVERGALESADNRDVVCRVKAGNKGTYASTIKWVIEDGTQVVKGQLIVELDASSLEDMQRSQLITVESARALLVQAEENHKIVRSQNFSDLETARIAVKLAELDLKKYLDGEYQQLLKDVTGRISIAESDLEQWRDRTAWSERMVKKGYLSPSQSESEASRRLSAEIALQKVLEEQRVLKEYIYERTYTELLGLVEEAKRALQRTTQQAKATEVQAESEVLAKRAIYNQELIKLAEIDQQISLCRITAPQDGMVVYYMPEQSRFGSGSQQSIVAQGEPVREGQKLMRIPDLRNMVVNTKVHEAMVSRLRPDVWRPTFFADSVRSLLMLSPDLGSRMTSQVALVEPIREWYRDREQQNVALGQKAFVRIDAMPDRQFSGHVRSVSAIASQADFMSSDVKVYQTMVAIDESHEGLKPGMSAQVTIHVDSTNGPVLTAPLTAIIGGPEMGRSRKCYVALADGRVEERIVEVGLHNETLVEIRSGVAEGDMVIANPKVLLEPSAKKADTAENRDGKGGSSEKGPGRGEKGKGRGEKGKGPPPAEG